MNKVFVAALSAARRLGATVDLLRPDEAGSVVCPPATTQNPDLASRSATG
jgi:hypothetical protein